MYVCVPVVNYFISCISMHIPLLVITCFFRAESNSVHHSSVKWITGAFQIWNKFGYAHNK